MIISENVLISTLTTMRLGGPAKYVIDIENKDDVKQAYAFAREKNLPIYILGFGANTIGHDEGFDGVIIRNHMKGITELSNHTITAMAGELWDDVVAFACERGLAGIEGLSKIPGLVGAAPVQNIGAYGQEIADTLVEIEVYDSTTDSFKTLNKSDLQFSYRHSILNSTEKGRYFVISITLELHDKPMPRPFYTSIERYIAENHCTDFSPQGIRDIVSAIRASKIPDPASIASSGSFFKNIYLTDEEADAAEAKGHQVFRSHEGNVVNSGWLIEAAGLKGKLLHGMRVCDKAALIIINESAHSYQDLAAARTEITNIVKAKFGYTLEQEPEEIQ